MIQSQTRKANIVSQILDTNDQSKVWRDIDNTLDDDGLYSTIFGPAFAPPEISPFYSPALLFSGFSFNIPPYATIKGIKATINRKTDGGAQANLSQDYEIYLYKNGLKVGSNMSAAEYWPTSFTDKVFGDATNLWGLTSLLPSDVNKKFGFSMRFNCIASLSTPPGADYVQFASMTIYYDDAFPAPEHEFISRDQGSKKDKKIWYGKVFNPTGTFVGELSINDFQNFPAYSFSINEGASDIRLKLNSSYNDMRYPENGQIRLSGKIINTRKGIDRINKCIQPGNIIKIFVSDNKILNKQIYNGIIAGYTYKFSQSDELEVNIIPSSSLLAARILKDPNGSTIYDFNSIDPATIITDIISSAAIDLSYDSDSMQNVGVERTYQFNSNYCDDAIKTALKLCPYGWYGYPFGDGKFYLRKFPDDSVLHTINKKNIADINFEKSIVGIKNRVLFLGAGTPALYEKYESEGSQKSWGLYEEVLSDSRVTSSETARYLADSELKSKKMPNLTLEMTVFDDNFQEGGYDIESIMPGDLVKITTDDLDMGNTYWGDFTWGFDNWKYGQNSIFGVEFLIETVEYGFNYAKLRCRADMLRIAERIEDISRDVQNTQTSDAPDLII